MKIDAHHHLWDLGKVNYPWLMDKGKMRFFGDPTDIQRNYLWQEYSQDAKSVGFQGSIHIQVGASDPLEEAKWVDSVNRETQYWPIAQVAFTDLTKEGLPRNLDQLQELKTVRGIRQIVGRAPEEDSLASVSKLLEHPNFLRGLSEISERGLTFDLQLIPEFMEIIAPILKKVPNLNVALCHAGSPYNRTSAGLIDWSESLKNLSNLNNVYCKLSGLGMFEPNWSVDSIKPIVETVINQFGSERVMFGSNFPVDSISSDYTELFNSYSSILSKLSMKQQNEVFGLTAQKFYSLTEANTKD